MNESLLLSTGPIKPSDRGRRCAIWESPAATSEPEILDTAALQPGDAVRYAGPDRFPPDCLLVVVSPVWAARLRLTAAELPYLANGPLFAKNVIDARCRANPELRRALRW